MEYQLHLKITTELKDDLKKQAKKEGLTAASLVRRMIINYIKEHKEEK